jgi:DNA (cytosine-5)-methyltransferase 1
MKGGFISATSQVRLLDKGTAASKTIAILGESARDLGSIIPSREQLGPQPRLLSLFSGIGGLDQGFSDAGFITELAVDNDLESVKTFAFNHPESVVVREDVNRIDIEKLDEIMGYELKPVGVVGGPPCQSFSVSNVYQRVNDPRHGLSESYANLLSMLNDRNPIKFFLFENVPGLLGRNHIAKYNHFKKLFKRAGFEIREALLNALDYGVPQDRPRVIIVGINQELNPGRVWIPPEPVSRTPNTVRGSIYGLPEPVYNSKGLDPDQFAVHPNHWCMVPKSAKFNSPLNIPGNTYGRSFRRLSWDQPSWAVAYGHREVHVHPDGHRRLSVYEAMLLQSFPKKYRLTGNISAQIRLISEAVPPLMAYHLALSIKYSLGLR